MEVVLAVGIMALGVVTILGLLPHGMEMSRKTANEQAETRIVDQLVGEVQASDWSTMAGLVQAGAAGITRFFDDQGLELTTAGGNLDSMVYLARMSLFDVSEVGQGARIPSSGNLLANPNLRRVMVEVVATQDQRFNFNQPPVGLSVKKFTQLVAKTRN